MSARHGTGRRVAGGGQGRARAPAAAARSAPAVRAVAAARLAPAALALAAVLGLSACSTVAPRDRGQLSIPADYKEATVAGGATWIVAGSAAQPIAPDWWRGFDDPELDRLLREASVASPTIAEAAANLAEAEALVRETRAARFPSLGANLGVQRSGGRRSIDQTSTSVTLSADWVPDLFGVIGQAVDASRATAEARAADLAAARLAVQSELAVNLLSLREADAEMALLDRTLVGYERSLQIANNRYAAGVTARTDVFQAETQLATTRADRAALENDRATLEHAIAVLVGRAPADLRIEPIPWAQATPVVPVGLPSTLLERRPDIAAAERAVAAASGQLGVARAAWYPSLALGGSLGTGGSRIGDLFSVSGLLWSAGVSVAQAVFDGGARSARIAGAEAARDAALARYRQTVLVAFRTVEDQLSAARSLEAQERLRRIASEAADRTEQQIENRYRSGIVNYTEVVTAQAQALAARRSLIQVVVNRQVAAVTLVRALGGGWSTAEIAPVATGGRP